MFLDFKILIWYFIIFLKFCKKWPIVALRALVWYSSWAVCRPQRRSARRGRSFGAGTVVPRPTCCAEFESGIRIRNPRCFFKIQNVATSAKTFFPHVCPPGFSCAPGRSGAAWCVVLYVYSVGVYVCVDLRWYWYLLRAVSGHKYGVLWENVWYVNISSSLCK